MKLISRPDMIFLMIRMLTIPNLKSDLTIINLIPDSRTQGVENSWYYKRPDVISGRLNSEPGWTMMIRPVWVPEHRELHSQISSWFKLLHVIFLLFPCLSLACNVSVKIRMKNLHLNKIKRFGFSMNDWRIGFLGLKEIRLSTGRMPLVE